MLEVNHLTSGYGNFEILHDVSFSVSPREIVGILGANGSGKTTLLKAVCGIRPHRGEIRLCGQDTRRLSPRRMALLCRYIPQRSGIGIDLPVLDVVLMGFNPMLGILENPDRAMRQSAMEALAMVGMTDRAYDNFQTLSEGQKQLCILARTMLLKTGMLFLDEPESALDFSGRYKIMELVRNWVDSSNGSALVTLHDPQLALNTCDRLLLLHKGAVQDVLCPAADSVPQMEEKLSGIFGSLSIRPCAARSGKTQFVLLKED